MNENFLLPGDETIETGDLTTLSEIVDWGLIDFAVPSLWEKNKGDNVKIMVCDTGISDHEDLNENIILNRRKSLVPDEDFVDKQGHGTTVIGVICAKESGFGIVGVAPHSKVIPVKVLSNNGFLKTMSSLENALKYAKLLRPDIVNMSLGGPSKLSPLFHKLLRDLYRLNIPVICAMGNSGDNFSCYPAEYLETIGVTSYKKDRLISNFSSRSLNADFALPGENILTTSLNNQYAIVNGTSFSAPFLSGVIAIIISEYKKKNIKYTIEDIKNILIQSCKDYGPEGKDKYYGYGIIDVNVLKNLL
jgi:subtilisin family serine protease